MILFTFFCFLTFLPDKSSAATYEAIAVEVNFFSPIRHIKKNVEIAEVEKNKLKKAHVEVTLKDPLKDCEFKDFMSLDQECQLALDALVVANDYIEFLAKLGIVTGKTLPIILQDPTASPIAVANTDEIRFAKLPQDDLADLPLTFMDVLLHEITHFYQHNLSKAPLGTATHSIYRSSYIEDHANLMTYMFGGRIHPLNQEAGMTVYSKSSKFGRHSVGNYGSQIAWNSSLVELANYVRSNAKNRKEEALLHGQMAKIYMELNFEYFQLTPYKDMAQYILGRIKSENLGLRHEKVEQKFDQILYFHGLDLSKKSDNGYTTAFLINDLFLEYPKKIEEKYRRSQKYTVSVEPDYFIYNKKTRSIEFLVSDLSESYVNCLTRAIGAGSSPAKAQRPCLINEHQRLVGAKSRIFASSLKIDFGNPCSNAKRDFLKIFVYEDLGAGFQPVESDLGLFCR